MSAKIREATNEMDEENRRETIFSIERGEFGCILHIFSSTNKGILIDCFLDYFSSQERRRPRTSSRSPVQQKNRRPRRNSNEDSGNHEWGKKSANSNDNSKQKAPPVEKEKPNFGLSGKLTEDTNKVNGVVINYAEPAEARKPKRRWRLYPFKG